MTGGADRIGRSQSATSLQIRQLEEVIGQPVFRRHGRGVTLTVVGEKLLPVARNVVQSLDTTLNELRGGGLKGKLRIGMTDDHSHHELTGIISEFAAFHPDVELEVQCAFGSKFEAALRNGDLDLAIHEVQRPNDRDEVLREDHLVWMCAQDSDLSEADSLPIALFDRDCWWRDLALSELEELGQNYQVIFSSESAIGVRSAVQAGIAAGLLCSSDSIDGVRPLAHLPARSSTFLVLQRAEQANGPICDAMCQTIRKAFGT
jgi:DNA-binding transcriptional LysR family regulator